MLHDELGEKKAYGLYRGVVANNKDPRQKGRLKLRVPQLLANEVTEWAWPLEVSGTKTAVPEVGQGVWVMFEGGDISYPTWVGVFGRLSSSSSYPLLSSATTLSGSAPYLVTTTVDGVVQVDLLASMVLMAQKLNNLEGRLSALEG